MCGIFCNIIYNRNTFLNELAKKGSFKQSNPEFSQYFDAFQHRGPDQYKELIIDISPYTLIQFAGSVLWTQGPAPVSQPIQGEDGNILLWNGDIFDGPLASQKNDTKILFEKLSEDIKNGVSLPKVFECIRGPYSFIFFHRDTQNLYFGRDIIGRHSLLIGFSQRSITITSVASKKVEGFSEVPAVGIFAFNLKKDGETPMTYYPWSHLSESLSDMPYVLPNHSFENIQPGETLESCLQPPRRNTKTPTTTDLSLWIVQRQDFSLGQLMEKLTLSDAKTRIKNTMTCLMAKPSIQIVVEDLLNTLKKSIKVRIEKQPKLCKNCVKLKLSSPDETINCNHSKVAILFSGGLDSAVLASLAHEFVTPGETIDLLNVAFEKIQKPTENKKPNKFGKNEEQEVSFNVPDRITGLSTLEELKTIHPERPWNFIEINVSIEELEKQREAVISNLIYPLNTVLDDSLGCALWFASRGQGVVHESKEEYTSPARIILSGIGADEQLGGYMRHRSTLKHKGGWEALDKELQYELKRISHRNLGRDDRIVSDHGRQLRMPYLDEDVINYLSFLPPWNRCNPIDSMPPGLGDKLLLRLAAWDLGFRDAANLPKKAMQFGSRIANSKEKGSDVSDRL